MVCFAHFGENKVIEGYKVFQAMADDVYEKEGCDVKGSCVGIFFHWKTTAAD